MRRAVLILGMLMLTFVVLGCAEKPPATVNGEVITKEVLDLQLRERLRMHEKDMSDAESATMREAVLSQLIDERLMLQAARKQGITANEQQVNAEFGRARGAYPDEAAFMAALKERGLTADSFKARVGERNILTQFVDGLTGPVEISDESLADHFDSLKAAPTMPERVKMRLIQTSDKARVEEIADRIAKAGADGFDTVADAIAEDPAFIVSQADWVQPGTFSLKMAEVVKGLEMGQWAGPVETRIAWYFIKVYEREEPRSKTFDESKDDLRMLMMGKFREDAVNNWLSQERTKATIVRNLGK